MEKKTLGIQECEFKFASDARTFEGYASVFDGVDSYGDTILKGAFQKTIETKATAVKMFFNHSSWQLPIGKWLSMEEDSKGLFVRGELTPNQSLANDVHASMKHQTLDGLSIGFRLNKGDSEEKDGIRYLKNIDLVEISPVMFPADDAARIALDSVKHDLEGIHTLQDLERFLRDVGSFSNSLAKTLVSKAKDVIQRDVELSETEKSAELGRVFKANQDLIQALKSF